MARNVYFSFHYEVDIWRANVVRNSWITRGGQASFWDRSLWEKAKKKGDTAIKNMINNGLEGTTATVVLIGRSTANRPWVRYEMLQSLKRGNGIVGVHINNIPNQLRFKSAPGPDPLDRCCVLIGNKTHRLSEFFRTHDYINDNGYERLPLWIEFACRKAESTDLSQYKCFFPIFPLRIPKS